MNQQTFSAWATFFNTYYGSLPNWPTVYNYQQWYWMQNADQQLNWIDPQSYSMLYSQSCTLSQAPKITGKLSRNQKRKMKKKELQAELEEEKRKIGDWIYLQRKPLIEAIKKIEESEEKGKRKKVDKLSHLIRINREVGKVYSKMARKPEVARCRYKHKKKKPSIIKKMKLKFQQEAQKLGKDNEPTINHNLKMKDGCNSQKKQNDVEKNNNNNSKISAIRQGDKESDYVTESEQQQKISKNETKTIDYQSIGKLTGQKYCNFRLRQWVTNIPCEQLQDKALILINKLAYKQALKKIRKPDRCKKIIVAGIHQCSRTMTTFLQNKRSRLLIVALNVERNNLEGGIDDRVLRVLKQADDIRVPIINISSRSNLGRAFTGKFGPKITMVSIVNFEGYASMMQQLLELWGKSKTQYDEFKPGYIQ